MLKKFRDGDILKMMVHILPHKYAGDIKVALDSIFLSLAEPHRVRRTLHDFLYYIFEQGLQIKSSSELSLLFHSYQEIELTTSENTLTTIMSNLSALRNTIEKLQGRAIFPKGFIAKILTAELSNFGNPENDMKKVLGGLDLPSATKGDERPLVMRLNVPVDEFLESLVNSIRRHRNTILHIARSYLRDANERLTFGDNAIENVPSNTFDDPENLSVENNEKGQRYSLFNHTKYDSALMNIVAYFHHKHDGLITADFIGGNNHVTRFGGSGQMREYFGLSTLAAVAAQIIIIIETGINISSLRSLQIGASGNLKDTFRLTETGFNIIYDKSRAGSKRNKQMVFVDDSKINSDFAFKYLLKATKRHRYHASDEDGKYLFIHQTMQLEKTVCRISDMPFKTGFCKLLVKAGIEIESNPEWCVNVNIGDIEKLLKHNPNAKQIRTSEGILRWYDSGGDMIKAATYLGNTESVAIRNYIPPELQDALHSHQIAKFQNLLLAAATNGKPYQADVLNLQVNESKNELKDYIAQLDILHPNWQILGGSKKIKAADANHDDAMIAMIFTKDVIVTLFDAFDQENNSFKNGFTPDEGTAFLSDVFKNLISYVNGYGKGEHRRLIQEVMQTRGGQS